MLPSRIVNVEDPRMRISRFGTILPVAAALLALATAAAATTVVRVHTVMGAFDVELFDKSAPLTVENFLNYATDGDWDGSFFHRSVPNFVVQGGGFEIIDNAVVEIPADLPVQNEPKASNVRGTLAMAKVGGEPDSATNEWFVNLQDNSENLDAQNEGFTVFGRVLGNGMEVVDAIAALPTVNVGGSLIDLPVKDWVAPEIVLPETNLVFVRRVEVLSTGCEAGQRAAASKLCKSQLSCLSKYAKAPSKDPTLASLDTCGEKASLKFLSAYEKAIASAVSKGAFCSTDDPDQAEDFVSAPVEALALDVLDVAALENWTSTDKADLAQRSGILKAAAGYCGTSLRLMSKEAKKPARAKLDTARTKARSKFDASVAKVLAKAGSAGADYPGRPVDEVGDRVEDITDEFAGSIGETNVFPVLDPVGDKAVDTGALLTFTATASDSDIPANALTFSLSLAPDGAAIDPVTGVFTWTPSELGIFEFGIAVTDDGFGTLADGETIAVTVTDPI
jgi:cyclophilin family peptidyl-prolyl cis-trans isomerase